MLHICLDSLHNLCWFVYRYNLNKRTACLKLFIMILNFLFSGFLPRSIGNNAYASLDITDFEYQDVFWNE